jgi:hypothetical protein
LRRQITGLEIDGKVVAGLAIRRRIVACDESARRDRRRIDSRGREPFGAGAADKGQETDHERRLTKIAGHVHPPMVLLDGIHADAIV